MNKGQFFVLKDGIEIKEIQQKMYSNGNGLAYKDVMSAEYAVSIGRVCECGKLTEKFYTACNECREKHQNERYNALELVEWDGKTPLSLYMGDLYFFDEDDIETYLNDCSVDVQIEDLQLVLCVPNPVPSFDLDDFLRDVLPEDISIDEYPPKKTKYCSKELEKMVNDYIEDVSPISWVPGNKRVQL